jgi:lipopolysaccharide/colanic/teichoic acid biosynthesis glycosyltransferase
VLVVGTSLCGPLRLTLRPGSAACCHRNGACYPVNVVERCSFNRRQGNEGAKRLFDVVLSSCGLIAAAPLILVIAIAIRVTMGKPVFYRQRRPGLHSVPFGLIKFRTMRDEFDARGRAIPQEERPTRLGYWLRRSSLDEIPELWTILQGDMSLVGPRPLLMEYLPLYTPEQARRHDVKPGLTGLAQVMGRHTVEWEDRFAYDLFYVDHQSLRLDARVLLRTVRAMTQGDGRRPANYFTGALAADGQDRSSVARGVDPRDQSSSIEPADAAGRTQ